MRVSFQGHTMRAEEERKLTAKFKCKTLESKHGKAGRWTDWEADRQTDRPSDRETVGRTDRQTERHTVCESVKCICHLSKVSNHLQLNQAHNYFPISHISLYLCRVLAHTCLNGCLYARVCVWVRVWDLGLALCWRLIWITSSCQIDALLALICGHFSGPDLVPTLELKYTLQTKV